MHEWSLQLSDNGMRPARMSECTVVTASLQNLPRMRIKRGCRVKTTAAWQTGSSLILHNSCLYSTEIKTTGWFITSKLSMQEKWIFPLYNESVGASVLDAMLRAAPSLQPLQTICTKMGLTAHLLRAFSLWVLEPVLSRKPSSDPSFQTSALDLDSLKGLPISVALATDMGRCMGAAPPDKGKIVGHLQPGKNFSPSGPKVYVTVLSSVCPKVWCWDSSSLSSFLKSYFLGLAVMMDQACGLASQLSTYGGQPYLIIPCI